MSRYSNRSLPLLLLCLCLSRSGRAAGPDADFNAHFNRAQELYGLKDYEGSIKELQAAHAIRPLPRLLLNIGQLQRKLGHHREAVAVYEIYLAAEPSPPPEIAEDLRDYMTRMRNAPPEPRVKTVVIEKHYREVRSPRPLWRIVTGSVALAGGLLTLGIGAAALAVDGTCTTNMGVDPSQHTTGVDRLCPTVYDTAKMGGVLAGVGAALLVAGAVTIALPGEKKMVEVSAAALGTGAGLHLAGAF